MGLNGNHGKHRGNTHAAGMEKHHEATGSSDAEEQGEQGKNITHKRVISIVSIVSISVAIFLFTFGIFTRNLVTDSSKNSFFQTCYNEHCKFISHNMSLLFFIAGLLLYIHSLIFYIISLRLSNHLLISKLIVLLYEILGTTSIISGLFYFGNYKNENGFKPSHSYYMIIVGCIIGIIGLVSTCLAVFKSRQES